MKKRLWIFYGCVFTMFCALAFRIFTLSDQYLATAADKQASVTVTVANTRGTIYDRSGIPLTNTSTEYRAAVTSNAQVLTALSLVMEEEAFFTMSKTLQNGRPAVITMDKLAAAEGITLFQVPIRYSGRVLAPHLLGYMDADKTEGLTGVEAALNSLLSSYDGTAAVTYTVDAHGKALSGVSPSITDTTDLSSGGVRLTLDAEIQEIAEDIAAKYIRKGAVVIMQPQSGDILAMVSLPTFQPDSVADVLQDADSPLLNRALCSYNCGSVFKIVSTAAALESGGTLEQTYTCNGSIAIGDTIFRCHHRLGHGNLLMDTAFSKSCNCYFIELMQEVGGDPLWQLANRLQFNSPITLLDGLQTKSATLPLQSTLQSPAVLANLSFGQGELTATPLHIAQLISTVVNNGQIVTPRIIKGYVDGNGNFSEEAATTAGQQVFSADTAAALRQMMEGVMTEEGTGYAGKPLYGTAGAKTGTAETGWTPAEDEAYAIVQSWFAGFYPADDPQYVIVVLAENADNTGAKTAPVFKEIAEALYYKRTEE